MEPSCYLVKDIPNTTDYRTYLDKHGCVRIEKVTGAQLHVVIRALPWMKSSPVSHKLDIDNIIGKYDKNKLRGLLFEADGGTDNDPDKYELRMGFWELMVKYEIPVIWLVHPAPGQSYLNEVERSMAILNNINGSILPNHLPDDPSPISSQKDLSVIQGITKFKKLFDSMIFPFLIKNWSKLKVRDRPVEVRSDWPTVRISPISSDLFAICIIY